MEVLCIDDSYRPSEDSCPDCFPWRVKKNQVYTVEAYGNGLTRTGKDVEAYVLAEDPYKIHNRGWNVNRFVELPKVNFEELLESKLAEEYSCTR